LSLFDVAQLSQASVESIDKGTLSRFEHGKQLIPVFKLITLSRIYDAPAEVLFEKLELDRALDHIGGPDTEGLDGEELRNLGRLALLRLNRKWDAYGYFRDGLHRPNGGEESAAVAQMNFATAARSLGKNRFALHELKALAESGAAGERRNAVLLDRISNCYRCFKEYDKAERYADAAVEEASFFDEQRVLAYACMSRAVIAQHRSDHERAIAYLRRAYKADRQAAAGDYLLSPNPNFKAGTLLKIASSYLHMGCREKAKRAALAAKKISTEMKLPAELAYSELILGRLDEREGAANNAVQRWSKAVQLARPIKNKRLSFAGEYYLFRHALRRSDLAVARASQRRIERLLPWIPEHFSLLHDYKELAGESYRHVPEPV
jgi:tetratricopeptide (TPR) repeat protein